MTKVLFAIFAHPDDEAFGPSGTLLKLRSEGYDIHLMLLTDGEAGTNPDGVADLGNARLKEWQAAARLLGAKQTHALHYPDGGLEQVAREELDMIVSETITQTLANYPESMELSFMTFEPRGLTSHRDHIVTAQLTAKIAKKFKAHQMWYFCLDSTQAPLEGTAYYQPRAREDSYITARIDISAYLDQKYRLIDAHYSQRSDANAVKTPSHTIECFHIDSF